jgi:hypothetical protein
MQQLVSQSDRQIQSLIQHTDSKILESESLLRILFTYPIARGPEYLDQLLAYLNVHVNFLYRDSLYTLLVALHDVLLNIEKPSKPVSIQQDEVVKQLLPGDDDGLEIDTDRIRALQPSFVVETLDSFPLPTLTYQTQAEWRRRKSSLNRPPELGDESRLDEDGQLLTTDEVETILRNGRKYIDLLLEYGINQERLDYSPESEASRYFAVPLQLFKRSSYSRIRVYALDLITQLVTLGLDPYSNILFESLHEVIRDGSNKSLDDLLESADAPNTNFDKATELLTALFRVGFDVNYQYMSTLTFAEQYGVPTHETAELLRIETVKYTGVSVIALCAIYNRADIMAWLLQYCGPLPLDSLDEDVIAPRTLDIDNMVLGVLDEKLPLEGEFLTFVVNLHLDPQTIPEQCDLLKIQEEEETTDYTPLDLALRHQSTDCHKLLTDYQVHLLRDWKEIDPTIHDISNLGYEA